MPTSTFFGAAVPAGGCAAFCRCALHHDPELQVVAEVRERNSSLRRRDLWAGAVEVLRGCVASRPGRVEHVLLAALLAAHDLVAVHAAQWHAEAVHLLEARLPPPHGDGLGEDSAL